jgi:hypothetical protein
VEVDRGIGNEDVDGAKSICCGLNQVGLGIRIADVACDARSSSSGRLNRLCGFVASFRISPRDHNLCAVVGEGFGDRSTDPLGRARDDRNLAAEVKQVLNFHGREISVFRIPDCVAVPRFFVEGLF